MSRFLNFFRRAPTRPLTSAEFLIDVGITAVAMYSSVALIAHHIVAVAVRPSSFFLPPFPHKYQALTGSFLAYSHKFTSADDIFPFFANI